MELKTCPHCGGDLSDDYHSADHQHDDRASVDSHAANSETEIDEPQQSQSAKNEVTPEQSLKTAVSYLQDLDADVPSLIKSWPEEKYIPYGP